MILTRFVHYDNLQKWTNKKGKTKQQQKNKTQYGLNFFDTAENGCIL